MGTERVLGCRANAQMCGMWHASTEAAVTCGSFCTGCVVTVGTLSLQAATDQHDVEGLTQDWPSTEYREAEGEWPVATSSIRSFLQNQGHTPSQETHSTPHAHTHSITYVGRCPRQAGRRWRPRHRAAHGGDPPGTAGCRPMHPRRGPVQSASSYRHRYHHHRHRCSGRSCRPRCTADMAAATVADPPTDTTPPTPPPPHPQGRPRGQAKSARAHRRPAQPHHLRPPPRLLDDFGLLRISVSATAWRKMLLRAVAGLCAAAPLDQS